VQYVNNGTDGVRVTRNGRREGRWSGVPYRRWRRCRIICRSPGRQQGRVGLRSRAAWRRGNGTENEPSDSSVRGVERWQHHL